MCCVALSTNVVGIPVGIHLVTELFFANLQLILWENEGGSVAGGFWFQLQAIQPDLVKLFAEEYSRLLTMTAAQPCVPLGELASLIRPPFVSTSRARPRNIR